MKIYFAGSLRGGREDVELYGHIVNLLGRHGQVLTEHVGQHDLGEDDLSDEAIFRRDMAWLTEADVLVAETTVPSHGVGYEIGRAEALSKPVLCLHRPAAGRRLSAMLAGNPNVRCESYRNLEDLGPLFDAFLAGH